MDRPNHPKPETVKNEHYKKWVRGNPCIVGASINQGVLEDKYRCGGDVVVHHTMGRSRDDMVIPLCLVHHRLIHDYPEDKWIKAVYLSKKHFTSQAVKYFDEYTELLKEF